MIKQTNFIRLVAFLLIVISSVGLLAQESGIDDEGNANNPSTNSRANACYTGGSMAETCVTQADWECGWALIRFEYGLFPRETVPTICEWLLPAAPIFVDESRQSASSGIGDSSSVPGPITESTVTPGPVIGPTATATATPPPVDYDACYFSWARYPLPALGQRVKGLIGQAGVKVSGVSAVAYGEDCISYATGQVKGFSAMETDFDISVSVADLADDTLDTQASTIRDVLNDIPKGDLSGGRIGQVYITFVSPTGETRKIGP
jgi:hypothetical protein